MNKGVALLSIILFLTIVNFCHALAQETGLFWAVTKPGSKDTSYLLGTIHRYPVSVVKLPPVVQQKLAECTSLYIEINPDWKLVFAVLASGNLAAGSRIGENAEWDEAQWKRIANWFRTRDLISEERAIQILQKRTSNRLYDFHMEAYGFKASGIENDLKILARKSNIPVFGLDKNWKQIQIWYEHYASRSRNFWNSGKLDSLLEKNHFELADMFIAYAIQDVKQLEDKRRQFLWSDGLTLAEWRNHNWMPQLKALMKNRTMVAVGAAHLYGPDGVLELLRKCGFHCIPIQASFADQRLAEFIRKNGRQYQLALQE